MWNCTWIVWSDFGEREQWRRARRREWRLDLNTQSNSHGKCPLHSYTLRCTIDSARLINDETILLDFTENYMGAGKEVWQFWMALPQSRGHVMSFSKNWVMLLTNPKQASNGCYKERRKRLSERSNDEWIRMKEQSWSFKMRNARAVMFGKHNSPEERSKSQPQYQQQAMR